MWSLFKGSFAEETFHFKGPANRSHPIASSYWPISPSPPHIDPSLWRIMRHSNAVRVWWIIAQNAEWCDCEHKCNCKNKAWCNCSSDHHQSVPMSISETRLLHTCVMPPSCVRHDSFTCETWLLHMWDMTRSYVRHDSFICETWLLRMWDMTLAHVQIAIQIICGTWLLHVWDMTPSCVGHDSFMSETWLLHICKTLSQFRSCQSIIGWLQE